MKKKNTTKTKLVATIISMVCALSLLAVGVMASLTNFQVAIANQLNLKFDAVEGTLYATRLGDVAGTDRTTSKVLSESSTATDWLKVYDGTTTEGVQNDALTSIQEKVDFISNDKIKEKVNAGSISIAITYYFYYTLPTDAVANNITLTAPVVSDSNIAITYSYVKANSASLPAFTDATTITDGAVVTISGGEHLFIKAEAKVDLSKSVKIENADWSFTLNFGISTYSLTNDTLTFNSVTGAETYEVWAKQNTTSGASLLAQTSSVGDTDSTLGTLVKILNSSATSVDLSSALGNNSSGNYTITILPKNASGVEIEGNRMRALYDFVYEPIKVTDEAIGGNYYYYIELGEYPQTVVEDAATISALNSLGDSAKTGKTFVVGASYDNELRTSVEYTYYGEKYVKVENAVLGPENKNGDTFNSGTVAVNGNAYWFKVEPIKWFLLEAYSTTKTAYTGSTTNLRVISENILTADVTFGYDYSKTTSANANYPLLGIPDAGTWSGQWDKSNMREWLNGSFYSNAFTADDQSKIVKNTTRFFTVSEYETKDDYTVTTGGSTTEDFVWLTSYYEMSNTFYGENMYLRKFGRLAPHTDFAIVNNLRIESAYYGCYWLRTQGTTDGYAMYVDTSDVLFTSPSGAYSFGVRPALTISI